MPLPTIEDPLGAPPETRHMAAELLPLFYEELRQISRRERKRLRSGATLQTTALIHEAYLKLQRSSSFENHEHFLRASALAMRHVLVDYARERAASKRGDGLADVTLEDAHQFDDSADATVVQINDALERLAQLSPRLAQIVECRFFAGYTEEETGLCLSLAPRTVRRDWVKARAWLRRDLAQLRRPPVDGAP